MVFVLVGVRTCRHAGLRGLAGFRKAVERAMIALTSLDIPVFNNIVQDQREVNGKTIVDYRLSRSRVISRR